jgi:ABC-type transporter Mla MlaB component
MAASAQRSVAIAIRAPLCADDLSGLFARTCALLEASACEVLRCEVVGLDADTVAVEALARLALAARRHRCIVHLQGASEDLLALVSLIGLDEVLAPAPTAARSASAS